MDLSCFYEKDKVLAFGTCLDIAIDKRKSKEKVNLAILCGAGILLYRIKDGIHPFLLNDIFSWKSPKSGVYKPGLYVFETDREKIDDPDSNCAQLSLDLFSKLSKETVADLDDSSHAWELYHMSSLKEKNWDELAGVLMLNVLWTSGSY